MRCALKYDENISFTKQNVEAWGEMQSLSEEPCYKEKEIRSNVDYGFFFGYKAAVDDVINFIDDDISKWSFEDIKELMIGNICMHLFGILDHQAYEDEWRAE